MMHKPDSDGAVRSCTPLEHVPDLTGMTEAPPLQIRSVTYYNSDGKPQYIHEMWLDDDLTTQREQWFRVEEQ